MSMLAALGPNLASLGARLDGLRHRAGLVRLLGSCWQVLGPSWLGSRRFLSLNFGASVGSDSKTFFDVYIYICIY